MRTSFAAAKILARVHESIRLSRSTRSSTRRYDPQVSVLDLLFMKGPEAQPVDLVKGQAGHGILSRSINSRR